MDCPNYITIPSLPSDPCNGERGNTKCIFSEDAYTLLEIPANSSLDVILNAFVLALNSAFTTNQAQQVVIDSLSNPQQPYKVYRALLTQTGTSAPTSTIIENTLSGNIIWQRISPGVYVGTLTGEFVLDKTFYSTYGSTIGFDRFFMHRISDNQIKINTLSYDETTELDNLLVNTPIEILVYE